MSGQIGDFPYGSTHAVNGQNLGWIPALVDHALAQNPAPGSAPHTRPSTSP